MFWALCSRVPNPRKINDQYHLRLNANGRSGTLSLVARLGMKLKQRAFLLSAFCALVILSTVALRLYLTSHSRSAGSTLGTVAVAGGDVPFIPVSSAIIQSSRVKAKTEKRHVNLSIIHPSYENTWKMWQSWVKEDAFYPTEAFNSGRMRQLLEAMARAPIVRFGIGEKGTQLKASVVLQGQQKALFKPRR